MKHHPGFIVLAMILGILSFILVYPFLSAIIWAMVTAYFLHYLSDKLNTKLNHKKLSSLIVVVVVLGLIVYVGYSLFNSLSYITSMVSTFSEILSQKAVQFLNFLNLPEALNGKITEFIGSLGGYFNQMLINWFRGVPKLIIDWLIYIVATFYFFKDSNRINHNLHLVLEGFPRIERNIIKDLIKTLDELLRGVFVTYLSASILVGILATVGFWAMGVEFYWGWGLLIAVAAFLPIIAAFMVYGPLGIAYIAIGNPVLGFAILIYGIVVLNIFPELIFRPYIGYYQVHEHPFLLLLGFIAGPIVLGFKGVILGPVILILFKRFLELYKKEVKQLSRT